MLGFGKVVFEGFLVDFVKHPGNVDAWVFALLVEFETCIFQNELEVPEFV